MLITLHRGKVLFHAFHTCNRPKYIQSGVVRRVLGKVHETEQFITGPSVGYISGIRSQIAQFPLPSESIALKCVPPYKVLSTRTNESLQGGNVIGIQKCEIVVCVVERI